MRSRAYSGFGIGLIGWLALSIVAALSVRGEAPQASSPFLGTRWTTENGLPQNSVTSIVQTPDGYLWLGTFGGLARFDGVKFTIFNSGNTPALISNRISTLHIGRDGSLWIGAETGEVTRFRDGRFSLFARLGAAASGNQVVWSIYEDRAGSLWVSAGEQGVTRFVAGDAARAEFYDERHGLPAGTIKSVCEDRDGNLWVCTIFGLAIFNPGQAAQPGSAVKFTDHVKAPAKDQLLRIRPHPDGGLWVLTLVALNRLHQGRFTPCLNYPKHITAVAPVSEMANGDLLFSYATDRIFQVGRTSGTVTEHRLAATGEQERSNVIHVYALCTDREGNIWLGTIGDGLLRLSRRRVKMFQPLDRYPESTGGPVLEDRRGNLWFGTQEGLFSLAGDVLTTHFTRNPLKQLDGWRVDAIYEDAAGDLWFGKINGVARYREGRFTEYPLPGVEMVQAICEDRSGKLWLGTWQGLVQFSDGKTYRRADGLVSDDVKFIMEDRDGALWLGTPQGLGRFRDGRFTNYTTAEGLSNNYVRAVHQDADGTLWLGTYGGGLNRMRNGRIAHVTTRHSLFDDFISRIIAGDDDTFWLLGNRGIFQVSRRALNEVADGQHQSLTCVVYDKADGMDPSEGQGGRQPAGWRARDGKLYFPTIRGTAIVDPSLGSKLAPPVVIERVVLDGAECDHRQPLELKPGEGNLEIHYTGLSFAKADQVRFSYQMSGQQEAWQDVGARRTVYFPQLQPGAYRFSVRAMSPDGVWSEHPASLNIVVKPPFWRTNWFASLAVMALAGLAFLGYRQRVAFYRKRVARQEEFARALIAAQEQDRKRLAAELHDGLGQSLVIIKRRGLLCLEEDEDQEAMREQVEEIVEASKQALEEVREMIFDLRPRQLDELGLTGAVADLLARMAGVNGWQLARQLDRVDGLLAKESENNLYRIVQESLNNISKHAAATQVSVSLTRQANCVDLTVKDNGRGFAPETSIEADAANGFGLCGIRERVRLLGGQVTIESTPGSGSIVRVTVPHQRDAKYANSTQGHSGSDRRRSPADSTRTATGD
jgi:signal transduction histidine kinase/ligand-binding sensor domain-containing protein